MKLPRFFIVLGACTFVLTFALHFIESNTHPAWAQTVPIQRADPWAGDPDEPGFRKRLPFEEEPGGLRASAPYELTSSGIEGAAPRWIDFWRSRILRLLSVNKFQIGRG